MAYRNYMTREHCLSLALWGPSHARCSEFFHVVAGKLPAPRGVQLDPWDERSWCPPLDPISGLRVRVFLRVMRRDIESLDDALLHLRDSDAVIFIDDSEADDSATDAALRAVDLIGAPTRVLVTRASPPEHGARAGPALQSMLSWTALVLGDSRDERAVTEVIATTTAHALKASTTAP